MWGAGNSKRRKKSSTFREGQWDDQTSLQLLLEQLRKAAVEVEITHHFENRPIMQNNSRKENQVHIQNQNSPQQLANNGTTGQGEYWTALFGDNQSLKGWGHQHPHPSQIWLRIQGQMPMPPLTSAIPTSFCRNSRSVEVGSIIPRGVRRIHD